jgi:hypothetical protein
MGYRLSISRAVGSVMLSLGTVAMVEGNSDLIFYLGFIVAVAGAGLIALEKTQEIKTA